MNGEAYAEIMYKQFLFQVPSLRVVQVYLYVGPMCYILFVDRIFQGSKIGPYQLEITVLPRDWAFWDRGQLHTCSTKFVPIAILSNYLGTLLGNGKYKMLIPIVINRYF